MGAWAKASSHRSTMDIRRGGVGGGNSEGWNGESGSSNATSDSESEEGEEEPSPLMASPWGTQESGESELRVGARAGGSGGRKATSGTADGGKTWICHGAQKQHGREKGGLRGWENDDPWGVGGNSGGR